MQWSALVCVQRTVGRRGEVQTGKTSADVDLCGVTGVEQFDTLNLLGAQRRCPLPGRSTTTRQRSTVFATDRQRRGQRAL